MPTAKKIDTVKTLSEKAGRAKSIVFVDYTGLKHKQLEQLRKALKTVEAEFLVTKNTLLSRALAQASDIKDMLQNNTATLFNYQDEVAGMKELFKFFKAATVGKAKGGLLGATVLTSDEVTRLSKLPPKEQLIGQLVGQLQSPIRGLHYALSWNINRLVWGLNNIKDKK